MKYINGSLLFFLWLSVVVSASAQIKPDYFPEDIGENDLTAVKCYCKPGIQNKSSSRGVELSYQLNRSGVYEGENDTVLNNPSALNYSSQFRFSLKIPLINQERNKLLLGHRYFSENYDFEQIGTDFRPIFENLNNTTFKNNSTDLVFVHSRNEINYLILRGGVSFNGDYNGFIKIDRKYLIYKMTALYAFKKHEDYELGFGINFNKSFRRTSVLPFVVYNRNFNDKWGLESTLPANAFLRYNISPKAIALLGIEYASKSYRFDVANDVGLPTLEYAFNHSELLASVNLDYQLSSWIWGFMKTGYQMNFSSDFEGENNDTTTFFVEPKNGLFIKFGLFVSPPKSFVK